MTEARLKSEVKNFNKVWGYVNTLELVPQKNVVDASYCLAVKMRNGRKGKIMEVKTLM